MTVTKSKAAAIMVAVLACGALLSGCKTGGSATPGERTDPPPPSSAASTPSEAPAGLPHSGAPKVNDPLPASVLDQPPCDSALTAGQLNDLLGESPAGRSEEDAVGTTCHWSKPTTGALISVGYATKVPDGLSSVYKNTQPQVKYWKPMPDLQGFPIVTYNSTSEGPPEDQCSSDVGIADERAFFVGVTIGTNKRGQIDPCEATRMVADMVLTNLKGAS